VKGTVMEGPQHKSLSPKLLVLVKLHKQPVTSRWFTIGVNSLLQWGLSPQKQTNKTDS